MEREEQREPIPVTVVAGFLGAGKTTLLNRLLTNSNGQNIAVVVNDFGSINIDAELITDVGEGMVSLANGCICCVIRSDLVSAVLKLTDLAQRPDHIVIESSGVADPESVVTSFMNPKIWAEVVVTGVVTVVDGDQVLSLSGQEDTLARLQIEGGDLIILNKVDLLSEDKKQQVRAWIQEVKSGAVVLETENCKLPSELILGLQARLERVNGAILPLPYRDNQGPKIHDHASAFESWTYESTRPLNMNKFRQVLHHLPATLYRAKGFIYSGEEPHTRYLLQLVARRASVVSAGEWSERRPATRLVCIARSNTCNFEAIGEALDQCGL